MNNPVQGDLNATPDLSNDHKRQGTETKEGDFLEVSVDTEVLTRNTPSPMIGTTPVPEENIDQQNIVANPLISQ